MLDPSFHITTPRLHLSYLDPSNDTHMAFFLRLHSSPEFLAVAAQSGTTPPSLTDIASARTALTSRTQRLSETGNGRYIISLRPRDPSASSSFTAQSEEEKEYVGYVSMQLDRFPSLSCPKIPDLGFILLAPYYGKGYASEACEGLMQYFRAEKGEERFAGFTHPENVASQKLFRRLGFESRGTREVAGIVGDGKAVRVAVWLKDVGEDVELAELGIGQGEGGKEDLGRLEKIEKSVV